MMNESVEVLELAAWGFDEYPYRPVAVGVCEPAARAAYVQAPALVSQDQSMAELWAVIEQREDLRYEMHGLVWSLEVVDLRALLSFQRRLSFDPSAPAIVVPHDTSANGLANFCFGRPKPLQYDVRADRRGSYTLQSTDPNFQVRPIFGGAEPLSFYAGSPFFEVAQYDGRWFLRDGYHRAYALLRQGISVAPAVVVRARTIAEVGAVHPWFFSEAELFSDDPPRLTDFLDPALTVRYKRPALLRTLRVTVEESFVPAHEGETQ